MEYTNNFTIDPYAYAQNRVNELYANQSANNAWSAMQAQKQNEFQIAQNAKAMNFNMIEAAKNRNWQEYMSNTAHQREVRDLRAAGLNPVLSAMNGNGAAVTSGATAQGVTSAGAKGDTDESINGAIASVLGSVLNADYSLRAQEVSAKSMENVANIYAEMDHIIAQLNADTSRYSADSSREAAKYTADSHYRGTVYSANMSNEAAHYAADRTKYGFIGDLFGNLGSFLTGGAGGSGNVDLSKFAKNATDYLDKGVSSAFGEMDRYINETGYPYIVSLLPFMKSVYDFFGYDPKKGPYQ